VTRNPSPVRRAQLHRQTGSATDSPIAFALPPAAGCAIFWRHGVRSQAKRVTALDSCSEHPAGKALAKELK